LIVSSIPSDVRDAAWQAYLAEDTVSGAIDAAVRVAVEQVAQRSVEARTRIMERHARRPDGKCVMCRWADGSVAAWPCPDYVDAEQLVSSDAFADGVAAGRAQAATDIRRMRDEQSDWLWFQLGESALTKVADWLDPAVEGGGMGDLSKDSS
jgi:hypothetical protein